MVESENSNNSQLGQGGVNEVDPAFVINFSQIFENGGAFTASCIPGSVKWDNTFWFI